MGIILDIYKCQLHLNILRKPPLRALLAHMHIGVCRLGYVVHAPATFQRCMMNIFSKLEKFVEVFMDDFTIHGDSFNQCLENLKLVLQTLLFLNQQKYTLDIISDMGLLGSKPTSTSIEQNHRLSQSTCPFLSDPKPYRCLVGRLIYLTVTRLDLAYSIHVLSQFMHEPREDHWDFVLRLIRYLKNCPGQGILLSSDTELNLTGWCDSDWVACPLTRRSLTGWLIFLRNSSISWKTKKQPTVARSSTEAEYHSMASITCELKWLKGLLLSLGCINLKLSLFSVIVNPFFILDRPKWTCLPKKLSRSTVSDQELYASPQPTI